MSPFDKAQARLAAVANTDQIIARQQAQIEELRVLRKQWDAELLNGTSDLLAAVHKYEQELIRFALRAANKSPKHAAELLGLKHQTLCWIINGRHKELIPERTPIYRRPKAL